MASLFSLLRSPEAVPSLPAPVATGNGRRKRSDALDDDADYIFEKVASKLHETVTGLLAQQQATFEKQQAQQQAAHEQQIREMKATYEEQARLMQASVIELVPQILPQLEPMVQKTVETQVAGIAETVRATTEAQENMTRGVAHRLEMFERRLKAPNIILKGVEEGAGEQRLSQVIALLPADAIKSYHRIGRPTATKTRPVLVECTDVAAKHRVFKKKKELRDSKISIDDDLTKQQLENRVAQAPTVAALRQEGWSTHWRGDVLYKSKGKEPAVKAMPHPSPVASTSTPRA